ncbi:MAG TPA: phage tail sheath subtilisin-like domain-containing protein [Roseiflexaceae bacterium]|nr:phage tail sheath subtilisin-like domain-containing protein [Roseiflexaceae bacterium]
MSPQYLSPGVYIEEVDRGSKPIEAAGTSVAAFVGFTEKRPEGNNGEPFLVTNWTQYTSAFGGFVPGAYLPLSVYGYFLNGGGICYIQSVAVLGNGTAAADAPAAKGVAQLPGKNPQITAAVEVTAQVGGQVAVTVEDGSADDVFKLTVTSGDTTETFENLTLNKGRGVRNAVDVVNKESKLIKLKELETSAPTAERRPAAGSYTVGTALAVASTTALAVSAQTFEGDVTARVGVQGLEAVDEVTMVIVPDLMTAFQAGQIGRDDVKAVQLAVMAHCEKMKDRVAILDSLPDMTPQQVNDWRMNEANYDSKYAALYYPWIWIANPLAGQDGQASMVKVPPSGHMAGLYARVDGERGVHKAPANEILRGAVKLETNVTKGEQDILNPNGINCIRAFPGRGIRVWGARTLSSDPSWRYVNVRRLFCMVEKSIERGTQWVVFEPNDPVLWAKVRRDVSAFLSTIWRTGALFGLSESEAFYVKCDAENNPKEERDLGRLFIDIGISPVKPAEFVVFRIGQMG